MRHVTLNPFRLLFPLPSLTYCITSAILWLPVGPGSLFSPSPARRWLTYSRMGETLMGIPVTISYIYILAEVFEPGMGFLLASVLLKP